jgi:hypothetical protein
VDEDVALEVELVFEFVVIVWETDVLELGVVV